jgi:hypothetical protein
LRRRRAPQRHVCARARQHAQLRARTPRLPREQCAARSHARTPTSQFLSAPPSSAARHAATSPFPAASSSALSSAAPMAAPRSPCRTQGTQQRAAASARRTISGWRGRAASALRARRVQQSPGCRGRSRRARSAAAATQLPRARAGAGAQTRRGGLRPSVGGKGRRRCSCEQGAQRRRTRSAQRLDDAARQGRHSRRDAAAPKPRAARTQRRLAAAAGASRADQTLARQRAAAAAVRVRRGA